MKYAYFFTVSHDEDMYRGYFGDFETLDTFGDTEEELYARASSMLAVEILESKRNGEDIPKASTDLEDYKKSLGQTEKVVTIEVETDDYEYLFEGEEDA